MLQHKRKKRHPIIYSFLFFSGLFLCVLLCTTVFDSRFAEITKEISHIESKITANRIIDTALSQTMEELQVSAEDFYIQDTISQKAVTANTMAINTFCTTLSSYITQNMKNLKNETIDIPFGNFFDVDILANTGPDISFSMQPKGVATVDYETAMTTGGINQIHFQIWLDIALEIQIVNPLYHESIPMQRKIMLVDTIFSGDIPNQYMQFHSDSLPIDRN